MVVHSRLRWSGFIRPSLFTVEDVAAEPASELFVAVDDGELVVVVETCSRPFVPFEGWAGRKAVELCRRVFTTSRGHVTTAPTVPAALKANSKTCR